MPQHDLVLVRISELTNGQEAECFAVLASKLRGTPNTMQPKFKCKFRDKLIALDAPVWTSSPIAIEAEEWREGLAYRLHVRAKRNERFGLQLEILSIRLAGEADEADGFNVLDFVECSDQNPEENLLKILAVVEKEIDDLWLKRLVKQVLEENAAQFKKMPAAKDFHHAYLAGLIEHVWSMTRLAVYLGKHYSLYYPKLNPPLNRSLIIAATILHDIGKIHELEVDNLGSKYSTRGSLIGHVSIGRDMIRDTARTIAGFPEELLMLLEHAILAHHGKREFGAPVLPQTMEAILVSHLDNLDAKMNSAACELLKKSEGTFTQWVKALETRLYKGIPIEPENDENLDPA